MDIIARADQPIKRIMCYAGVLVYQAGDRTVITGIRDTWCNVVSGPNIRLYRDFEHGTTSVYRPDAFKRGTLVQTFDCEGMVREALYDTQVVYPLGNRAWGELRDEQFLSSDGVPLVNECVKWVRYSFSCANVLTVTNRLYRITSTNTTEIPYVGEIIDVNMNTEFMYARGDDGATYRRALVDDNWVSCPVKPGEVHVGNGYLSSEQVFMGTDGTGISARREGDEYVIRDFEIQM